MNKSDFISYPYLNEPEPICDHELLTDSLACLISNAALASKDECPEIEPILDKMTEGIYHVNGSVRGEVAVTENDLNDLHGHYIKFKKDVDGVVGGFVLPGGCKTSRLLHIARCEAKKVVRNMHMMRSQNLDVSDILFDYVNLCSNFLFVFAVYSNMKNGIDEKLFNSKSYHIEHCKEVKKWLKSD